MPGIAIGSIGDSCSFASIKSYIAEFISTLLFIFAGVGSAIAFSKYFTIFSYLFIYFFARIYIVIVYAAFACEIILEFFYEFMLVTQ